MTWCLLRTPDGGAYVEHHALVRQFDVVISRHPTITEARTALDDYRERREREALRDAGQKELFA